MKSKLAIFAEDLAVLMFFLILFVLWLGNDTPGAGTPLLFFFH